MSTKGDDGDFAPRVPIKWKRRWVDIVPWFLLNLLYPLYISTFGERRKSAPLISDFQVAHYSKIHPPPILIILSLCCLDAIELLSQGHLTVELGSVTGHQPIMSVPVNVPPYSGIPGIMDLTNHRGSTGTLVQLSHHFDIRILERVNDPEFNLSEEPDSGCDMILYQSNHAPPPSMCTMSRKQAQMHPTRYR